MTNGVDSEEFVLLSKVRTGLKREFAFALKGQMQIAGSIGRTRVRKVNNALSSNGASISPCKKRLKASSALEETLIAEKGVVDTDMNVEIVKVEAVDDLIGHASENLAIKDGGSVELAVMDDDEFNPEDWMEKPSRRFTRSVLKPNVESNNAVEDVKSEGIGEIDDGKASSDGSPVVNSKKLEMKMSKKIALKKFPTKLKDLLDTGLLEGLPVKYIRGFKAKAEGKMVLKGVIRGSGIQCSCDECKGVNIVTPLHFEQHAGSGNKRAPEYIFLENGKSLREVLNACNDASLNTLEATIQKACGCTVSKYSPTCQTCKGSLSEGGSSKSTQLCSSCTELDGQSSPTQTSDDEYSLPRSMIRKPSVKLSKSHSAHSKKHGKLTRKDLRLHKLVFEEGGLPDNTEVGYYTRGQLVQKGHKEGFGIYCYCCNNVVSPSVFEDHAGYGSRRKPYLHIYTSNGVSLHELSVSLSKGRKLSANDNDDLCTICADGGDLLCCDGCPRAFHKDCISLPSILPDRWYCKYCENVYVREKYVERNANAIAAGRVAGVDPIEQITNRCIRIIKSSEAEVGGCGLCSDHRFSKSGFGPLTVIICDQCEKEYHVGCLRRHKMVSLKQLPKGKWFCCTDCNSIHNALVKLVAHGEEKLTENLLNVITNKHDDKATEDTVTLDIRWRVLSGKMSSDESRLLLSKAVAIFHDRFDPILDATTGRDFIPPMVYGRNMRDQEFGGMYCAVLTVNSVVVSAGIFRVFGAELAELPLVATSSDCQGQGYFQSLFSCIERLLGSLNVKNLVLPAAEEAESIWTNKFGFTRIPQDELHKYRGAYQMMRFQGTEMLQKLVPKCEMLGE